MKYTISNETAAKLEAVKPTSKYYLTPTDEKNKYYVEITAENGTVLKIPFKAMFFKDVSIKLGTILSMSNSSTHCSSNARGMCQLNDPENECYGLRIENQYKREDIINSYESNHISGLILSKANITYLSEYINKIKPNYIRFNKHGDFINDSQFLKFLNLAQSCNETIFYGYTARDDILETYKINSKFLKEAAPNLKINGSNKKYTNRFKVVYTFKEYIKARYTCKGNCTKCKQCINLEGKTITVLYHGSNAETVLNTEENRRFICDLLTALDVPDIHPDELKQGKLFNKLNKAYQHYYNINLKKLNYNSTKEFIDGLTADFKELKNAGVWINWQEIRRLTGWY